MPRALDESRGFQHKTERIQVLRTWSGKGWSSPTLVSRCEVAIAGNKLPSIGPMSCVQGL